MIRKARIGDAKAIHRLLIGYAGDGLMLSRSLPEIYETIRDIYVFEDAGAVVGTVWLHVCWEDLAEIRSLAVAAEAGGKGIGRLLVDAAINEAREIGMKRVFCLTYQPGFFGKIGFNEIEKSELPHKIWGDCIKCAKFPECDEIAMQLELASGS
ncbi:MAG: GNAT family N-acetyltransferase [Desulfuromonas sp.]|nr:MAG: GNAT family N-acetyltransferase [Desulfuromonas sp.]